MVDSLPDVPGHRFMYDQDGTVCFVSTNNNASTPLTQFDGTVTNDEDLADDALYMVNTSNWKEISYIFPELRDIKGIFLCSNGNSNIGVTIFTSTDTTDGTDGTWVQYGSQITMKVSTDLPTMRSGITNYSNINGIKGIRFRMSPASNSLRFAVCHLYGVISPTINTERLEFWSPSADSILDKSGLDFGDVSQGQQKTKLFRVKNLSTTKTAGAVVITRDTFAGVANNQPMIDNLKFSLNGMDWSNSVTINSLAPGAISPTVYVRRTVGSGEAPNLRFARIKAVPTTFAA